MYPESKGQHGYFAYIFIYFIFNLAYTFPASPFLLLSTSFTKKTLGCP